MNQNNENLIPKPSELESSNRPNRVVTVSPIPLGIISSVLSSLLLAVHVFFLWRLYQMSLQEKMDFVIYHNDLVGRLQGAEIVGIPVALALGVMSRRTKVGRVGLLVTGVFLLAALYIFLFGLPLSIFIVSPPHQPHVFLLTPSAGMQ